MSGMQEYDDLIDLVEDRLRDPELRPLPAAQQFLQEFPEDGYAIELAAFAALVEHKPDLALRYLKKYDRNYFPTETIYLAKAIALAQLGKWPIARSLFEEHCVRGGQRSVRPPNGLSRKWLMSWLDRIHYWRPEEVEHRRRGEKSQKPAQKTKAEPVPAFEAAPAAPPGLSPLPRMEPQVKVRLSLPEAHAYQLPHDGGKPEDFLLRLDLAHLSLLQSYDELLCLAQLHGVTHYQYQTETVRKVLKQFHGRVLLADEVGLGKTIEAGMVLKEYMLRGMAGRVLILTPPSLVGQWQEEMESKFGIQFMTTHHPLLHRAPAEFWSQPRIISSIATARRDAYSGMLAAQTYDIVIADEAHHLKNRSSKNWKLVDTIQKRFLLLLSATPVENNLVELYNLLTLLKPGIFKTEREFRSLHISPDNPRIPIHRERLHDLMRDVMVRNTRALADVKLPPRHAATLQVEPPSAELECYVELGNLIRSVPKEWLSEHHLALRYLLESAGSSPRAVASSLARFLRHDPPGKWKELQAAYEQLGGGAKAAALLELLARNPEEQKMVFVRFRDTLHTLAEMFERQGIAYAVFDGQMTGPEKDAAVERFRGGVPILLCTETGGEGRNVQFCATIVNFDLPWNPQQIEQRIGRVHRIGQTREVYVFNLATRHTLEEHILRILDEKIHMFELVVGEIQSILGEMADDLDFASLVFSAWLEQSEEERQQAFARIGEELAGARSRYESAKALDEEIFGDEFETL